MLTLIRFVLFILSALTGQIEKRLESLASIQLEEAEKVKLFDRTDSKYIFHIDQLGKVFESLSDEYRILEAGSSRNQAYKSLYFDTKNFKLYYGHHNGLANRYKVRIREYVSTATFFLEIKFKTNQDRTLKKRCLATDIRDELNTEQLNFIANNTPFNASELQAFTWTNFNRITLIHKTKPERVTIDTDPQWIYGEKALTLPSLVIAEVKRDKMEISSFAVHLKEMHIQEIGFSKYCIGNAFLNSDLRYNLFKPTLLSIKKICRNELPYFTTAAN